MAVKVTGQFEPAGDFPIVDGADVSGNITGSNISASGTITTDSLTVNGDQTIAGSMRFGDDISDTHRMTGSLLLSGSLGVDGQVVMQEITSGSRALIVSGSMEIVEAQIGTMVQSASIIVSGLGTIGHRDLTPIIDLGEGFSN
tara:strand:- start:1344 stop:1772 length:429 start_codon:yes stop_codon:yes gene_type:complete